MAKIKTTTKALKEGYNKRITLSYCELQNLLRCIEPIFYNSGVYGWNYDAYIINGVLVSTGYRGMPSGVRPSSKLVKKYEKKIEKINAKYGYDWTPKQKALKKLLNQFVVDVFEEV